MFIFVVISLSLLCSAIAHNCSWNYRFDSIDNHFNIVYPDKNAVYFGMIIPSNSTSFNVISQYTHPIASYFSIQIYELGGIAYHYNDAELLGSLSALKYPGMQFALNIDLNRTLSYFALFRIYAPLANETSPFYYWAGIPPRTIIDNREYQLCDIDYEQQGNIYTNFTHNINPVTGTVCMKNDEFVFMEAPSGSLVNADANYMIACIQSGKSYRVTIQLPVIMCSLDRAHPHIDEYYDLRYASLSIISTVAPRPTITSYQLPCNESQYTVVIEVGEEVTQPGLLYRQLLPDPAFPYSIAVAKSRCFDYVNNVYDDICIRHSMGAYYPNITLSE